VLGDELYGFKDWNDRYAKLPQGAKPSDDVSTNGGSHRARFVRPLLHAAELVLPLPPWSVSSLGRHGASSGGGSQQQQHWAAVEESQLNSGNGSGSSGGGDKSGNKQLRLRCGMPSDFASVARTITGEDMDFSALLGPLPTGIDGVDIAALSPSTSTNIPLATKSQASNAQPQQDESSRATKEHRAALLAAAEASEDGWYD
jgi:hypothetical protein